MFTKDLNLLSEQHQYFILGLCVVQLEVFWLWLILHRINAIKFIDYSKNGIMKRHWNYKIK